MNNRMVNSNRRFLIGTLVVTALIIVFSIVGYIISVKVKNTRITKEFYAARDLYEQYLHTIEEYTPENSCIDRIVVITDFKDRAEWANYNYYVKTTVNVFLKREMRDLSDREAFMKLYPHAAIINDFTNEMRQKSGFGDWVSENKWSGYVNVGGVSGILRESTHINYIVEGAPRLEYEVSIFRRREYGIIQGTFTVTHSEGVYDKYSYSISDNSLYGFEKQYHYDPSERTAVKPDTDSSQSAKPSTSGKPSGSSHSSSGGSGSSSGSGKKYDIYHVYDYDSAWDFANDKYEEFFDYEDDYEDEDEAFDAAEDYWRKHHGK